MRQERRAARIVTVQEAYKFSGDVLVKTIFKKSYSDYELAYPILFNYRHAVELYIKSGISESKKGHEISKLLSFLEKELAEKRKIDIPTDIKARILDFNEFDKGSMAFRYNDSQVVSSVTGDTGEFWVDFHYLMSFMDEVQRYFTALQG